MKKDIQNRADIELLVNSFFEKVQADDQLGSIFNEIAIGNWPCHLVTLYNFWENIVLFTGAFEGNPMHLLKHLQHIKAINETHFARCSELFNCAADQLFEGENAKVAKQRTLNIISIIKLKILKCP
ncbi:MAG: group III truncated hemoglobin [Ferruginibacter sp.]